MAWWLLVVVELLSVAQGPTVARHSASHSFFSNAAARQQPEEPLGLFAIDNTSLLLRRWSRPRIYSIVFNKISKCSSSSAGGVMRALAHHMGLFPDTQILGLTNASAATTRRTKIADNGAVAEATLDGFIKREPFVMATHLAAQTWQALQRVSVRVLA